MGSNPTSCNSPFGVSFPPFTRTSFLSTMGNLLASHGHMLTDVYSSIFANLSPKDLAQLSLVGRLYYEWANSNQVTFNSPPPPVCDVITIKCSF